MKVYVVYQDWSNNERSVPLAVKLSERKAQQWIEEKYKDPDWCYTCLEIEELDTNAD